MIEKWPEEEETPEMAKKICKAVGYDPSVPIKAIVFVRRYVSKFLEIDTNISGYLEIDEMKESIRQNKDDEDEMIKELLETL